MKMSTSEGVILLNSNWGSDYALTIPTGNSLELIFPEPCANVYLNFAQNNNCTIEYYKRSLPVDTTNSNLPVYEWELITSGGEVNYEDSGNPVDRIVIINGECEESNLDCGTELTPEAQQLFNFLDALENNGDLTESFKIYPDDSNTYENIYYDTVLYGSPNEDTVLDYNVQLLTLTQLVVTIIDNQGFSSGLTKLYQKIGIFGAVHVVYKFISLLGKIIGPLGQKRKV